MSMGPRFNRAAVLAVPALMLLAWWTGSAAADSLPGCASGAAPGQVVFTVSVSASGTPFVSTYVASAPTASGNVGCAAPQRSGAATFTVAGPNVAVYPQLPVPVGPAVSTAPVIPSTTNLLQVGSYLLTVPVTPGLQVYQIAPGYYVVRSTDSTQNPSVIILPMPGVPQAPNTGPIPSLIH
jgi:hypothetical protein